MIVDGTTYQIRTERKVDLQFWYNGVRKLIFEHKTFGVVYAPHAAVEIKLNGHFTGAIVANRIIGEGNNHFVFDQHLLEVVSLNSRVSAILSAHPLSLAAISIVALLSSLEYFGTANVNTSRRDG
jgi:hypothetical protein